MKNRVCPKHKTELVELVECDCGRNLSCPKCGWGFENHPVDKGALPHEISCLSPHFYELLKKAFGDA